MVAKRALACWKVTYALLLLGAPLACGDAQEQVPGTQEQGPGNGETVLAVDGRTCDTCLSFHQVVELGQEDGPGYLRAVFFVALDSTDNYWVSQPYGPKVYSPEGEFLGQVGQEGEGPGDFRDAGDLYVDERNNVHVFDRANVRETVIGPDRQVIATSQLAGPYSQAVPIGDGRLAVNFASMKADLIGLPIHVVQGDSVLRSFGPTEGAHSLRLNKTLAYDPEREILYSIGVGEYLIEAWSRSGVLRAGYRRVGLWEPRDLMVSSGPVSPDNPPHPYVSDLRVDSDGRVWIAIWVPRDDWQNHLEERRLPDGRLAYVPQGGVSETLMRSIVEVVDPKAARVVYQAEFDELIGGFLGDTTAYGITHDPIGAPRLTVWSINIQGGHP